MNRVLVTWALVLSSLQGAVDDIHLERGQRFLKSEDHARAAEEFRKACDANPKSARAYFYLGAALFNIGDYEQCADALLRSIITDPSLDGPATRHYLAIAYYQQKLYRQSKAEFELAYQLDPKSKLVANIHKYLANIDAVASKEVPENTKLWYYSKGIEFFQQKKYERARDHFAEVYLIDPAYKDARVLLAACHNHIGLYGRTLALLENRTDLDSLYQAGFAQYHLGEYAKAAEAMEKVWAARKKPESALYAGRAYARLGKPESAAQYWNEALKANPALQPVFDLDMGILYIKVQKPELARNYLEKARTGLTDPELKTELERWLQILEEVKAQP